MNRDESQPSHGRKSALFEPGRDTLRPEIQRRAHEVLAALRAKKAALDAGLPPERLGDYDWVVESPGGDEAETGDPLDFDHD